MDKNRFIISIPNDTLGGAEYFLKNMGTHLSRDLDYEGEVVFMKRRETGAWEDLSEHIVLNYGKHSRELFAVFSTAWRLIRNSGNKTKLVLSSHAHLNGLNCLLRRLGLLKCDYLVIRESNAVYDRHSGFKLLMVKFFHRFTYQASDLIICQTDYMKERLIEGSKYAHKWNIQVIPNPVPLDAIMKKAQESISSESKLPENYIVAAGRLIPIKGFNYLMEAFSQLADKSLNLVILGGGHQRKELEEIARKLDIEERTILPGFVNNPMPYFRNARACVVSSVSEGFPNVLLQMMCLNDKVVSTRCAGGIEEIPGIEHCATENSSDLNRALAACLRKDSLDNRSSYDHYLNKRSPSNFYKQMFKYLKAEQ